MAEIYVNSNSPISTKIFYAGAIVDADGDVAADIYDITEDPLFPDILTTTVIHTVDVAKKSEVNIGSYDIDIPFSLTTRNRKLKIVWSYSVGPAASHTTYADVVTPYCNLAEAIDKLNIGTDPSDPNHKSFDELLMAERWARKVIENHTSQRFYLYDDSVVSYGAGSDILPLAAKLSTIHKVYKNDVLVTDNINSVYDWAHIPVISESGFGIKVAEHDNTFGHIAFSKDARYKVQGKFGWTTVPGDIQEACIVLMGDFFGKDKVWRNKYIKNIQTFDWKFEYSPDAYSGTGNLYADQLLAQYIVSGMVVMASGLERLMIGNKEKGVFKDSTVAQVSAFLYYQANVIGKLTSNKSFQSTFSKVIFDQIKEDFGAYLDSQARVKPKSLHHVYEWDKAGVKTARLFKLKKISQSGLSFKFNYELMLSKSAVPTSLGRRKHVFVNKASVMEAGMPVKIAPAPSKRLVFESDGITVFMPIGSPVTVKSPGGRGVRNQFSLMYSRWFSGQSVNESIKRSGFQRIFNTSLSRAMKIPQNIKRIQYSFSPNAIRMQADSALAASFGAAL